MLLKRASRGGVSGKKRRKGRKAGRETEEHTSWELQRASQAKGGLSKDNGGVPFTFYLYQKKKKKKESLVFLKIYFSFTFHSKKWSLFKHIIFKNISNCPESLQFCGFHDQPSKSCTVLCAEFIQICSAVPCKCFNLY